MEPADLVLVEGEEEWTALYVDGVMAVENHSLSAHSVLRAIAGRTVKAAGRIVVDDEWLEGGLPQKLSDIPERVVVRREVFS